MGNQPIGPVIDPLIVIFLKQPAPGRVKTRLAAKVGDAEAARIYRLLAEATLRRLRHLPAQLCLYHTPATQACREQIDAWLSPLLDGRRVLWWPQPDAGLGQRQTCAIREARRLGFQKIALVGTDCIDLNEDLFTSTWRALETHDWVFGPARDGGYYLAATAHEDASVLDGVRWSCAHTLADCRRNALAAGRSVALLDRTLDDVDHYEDWLRVRDTLEEKR